MHLGREPRRGKRRGKNRHFVARSGLAWVSERLLHLLIKSWNA
jgi:hypothetical protein